MAYSGTTPYLFLIKNPEKHFKKIVGLLELKSMFIDESDSIWFRNPSEVTLSLFFFVLMTKKFCPESPHESTNVL